MKRELSQLVSQHLENISRDALARYQKIIRQYVLRRPGVYALYRRGKLYYVGLAGDLRWRLKSHLKDRHGQSWDRFSVYLTIGDKRLRELESLLLRIIKPKGNEQVGKLGRSENLLRRFGSDIRRLQRDEFYALVGRLPVPEKIKKKLNSGRRAMPPLAGLVTGAMTLQARFKGKTLHAQVRRDGTLRFAGKVYRTPSAAGMAACKRSCNGWWFWKYQRAPGDWVRLRELRN